MLLKSQLHQLETELWAVERAIGFKETPTLTSLRESVESLLQDAQKLKKLFEVEGRALEGPELQILYISFRELKLQSRFVQRKHFRLKQVKVQKNNLLSERKSPVATFAA